MVMTETTFNGVSVYPQLGPSSTKEVPEDGYDRNWPD